MAQGMKNIALDFSVAGIEDRQEILDLFAGGFQGTGTGIGYFRKAPAQGELFNLVFFQEGQRTNDGQAVLKQGLFGEHGAEFSAEKHI